MILSYATYKNDHACIIDSVFNESELHTLNASEVWARAEEGIQNQSLINVCEVDGVKCEGFYFFGVRRTIVSEVGAQNHKSRVDRQIIVTPLFRK